jgi:hypothetical protein
VTKTKQISLLGLIIFVGLITLIGALLPREWQAERHVVVESPTAEVYEAVADFRNWEHWAGWNTSADPSIQVEFKGAARGEGAIMAWQGERIGEGKLEITSADPETGIHYTATINNRTVKSSITFEPVDDGTRVSWQSTGLAPRIVGGYLVPYYAESWADQKRAGLNNLKEHLDEQSGD